MKSPFQEGSIAAAFTGLHPSPLEKKASSDSCSCLCVSSSFGWAGAGRGSLEERLVGGTAPAHGKAWEVLKIPLQAGWQSCGEYPGPQRRLSHRPFDVAERTS